MIEEKAKVAEKIYVKHENKLIFFRKKFIGIGEFHFIGERYHISVSHI